MGRMRNTARLIHVACTYTYQCMAEDKDARRGCGYGKMRRPGWLVQSEWMMSSENCTAMVEDLLCVVEQRAGSCG